MKPIQKRKGKKKGSNTARVFKGLAKKTFQTVVKQAPVAIAKTLRNVGKATGITDTVNVALEEYIGPFVQLGTDFQDNLLQYDLKATNVDLLPKIAPIASNFMKTKWKKAGLEFVSEKASSTNGSIYAGTITDPDQGPPSGPEVLMNSKGSVNTRPWNSISTAVPAEALNSQKSYFNNQPSAIAEGEVDDKRLDQPATMYLSAGGLASADTGSSLGSIKASVAVALQEAKIPDPNSSANPFMWVQFDAADINPEAAQHFGAGTAATNTIEMKGTNMKYEWSGAASAVRTQPDTQIVFRFNQFRIYTPGHWQICVYWQGSGAGAITPDTTLHTVVTGSTSGNEFLVNDVLMTDSGAATPKFFINMIIQVHDISAVGNGGTAGCAVTFGNIVVAGAQTYSRVTVGMTRVAGCEAEETVTIAGGKPVYHWDSKRQQYTRYVRGPLYTRSGMVVRPLRDAAGRKYMMFDRSRMSLTNQVCPPHDYKADGERLWCVRCGDVKCQTDSDQSDLVEVKSQCDHRGAPPVTFLAPDGKWRFSCASCGYAFAPSNVPGGPQSSGRTGGFTGNDTHSINGNPRFLNYTPQPVPVVSGAASPSGQGIPSPPILPYPVRYINELARAWIGDTTPTWGRPRTGGFTGNDSHISNGNPTFYANRGALEAFCSEALKADVTNHSVRTKLRKQFIACFSKDFKESKDCYYGLDSVLYRQISLSLMAKGRGLSDDASLSFQEAVLAIFETLEEAAAAVEPEPVAPQPVAAE